MKNKIILNILLAYFLILTTVLLIQLSSKKADAIEPLPTDIATEDKLKNAVVLAINSPVAIINEKQFLIDDNDATLVPIIDDGKVYIPAKLLKTAFNADISFSKQTKETTIRLDNKAMIFSSNNTSIKVLDNTKEQTVEIEAKSKIINDRFYIPLRCFADVFNKEVFYNNNLIIISNMANIFDPIEEIKTIDELLKQVEQLPIVGNEENLKNLLSKTYNNIQTNNENNLIDTQEANKLLAEKERVIIKKTNNYNIYLSPGFIEAYFVDKDKKEHFSFKVEILGQNIKDIAITDDRFIVSYQDDKNKTVIYDISNRANIQIFKIIENNGDLFKNIIDENNLYNIAKIDINYTNRNILPVFSEYLYQENSLKNFIENDFSYKNICYFPDMNDSFYTLITYVNLYEDDKNSVNIAFLGMGDRIIINEDMVYVLTNNKENNNLYQFKANLDCISYVTKVSFKGEVLDIKFDKEKEFIEVSLKDEKLYFDDALIKR